MTEENRKILDKIRQLLVDNQLSFLVGAGFSKNISPKFPLWKDLFNDAVWDMYGNHCDGSTPEKRAAVIDEILRKTSLLDIASRIVSDAGYHEAIDEYIEKHTPYLATTEHGPVLMLDGEVCDDNPSFECHNLLKQLDVHNIYTFNYDNALEYCLGDKSQHLENLSRLKKEVADLEQKRDDIYARIARLSEGADQPVARLFDYPPVTEEDSDSREEQRKSLVEKWSQIKRIIGDKRRKIDDLKMEIDNGYLIVKQSSDIALTSTGHNLYKIHGDLRVNKDGKYGFDGDTHTQYIITRDDYETYQRKHAAFVNLMRIDLLRNRFCIIGLSGSDANFLSWIRWVKDVLDKADDLNGPKDSFFIYSSDNNLSDGMVQMLKNHFITPVILKDIFPDAPDDRYRIKAFLEAVQPHKYVSSDKLSRLWEKVKRKSFHEIESKLEKHELDELCEMSSSIIFHKYASWVHYTASDIFAAMMWNPSGSSEPSIQKLFAAAIRCSLIPMVESSRTDLKFMSESEISYVREAYDYAKTRAVLLTNPASLSLIVGVDEYSNILKRLFLFDFPCKQDCNFECKSAMDHVRQRAVRQFLYEDVDGYTHDLDGYFSTPQELVLAADALRLWDYSNPSLSNIVKKYQSKYSLFTLEEYLHSYLNEMDKAADIDAYGNVTERIHIRRGDSDYLKASVVINSLIELGIVSLNRTIVSDEQWMKIVRHTKSTFVFPLAFYTVSGDFGEGTIVKVAQELIYDNYAYQLAPELLNCLISALMAGSTPKSILSRIAIFARELLMAVSVDKWKSQFVLLARKVFTEYCVAKWPKSERELFLFLIRGVPYVKDTVFRLEVIKYVLSIDTDNVFWDNLLNGLVIAASEGLSAEDFKPVAEQLVNYAKRDRSSDTASYIIMNLSRYLSEQDFLRIKDILETRVQKDNNLADSYAFRVQSFPDIASSYRQSLICRKDIWNTGAFSSTRSSSDAIVKIGRIDEILHFGQNQVSAIYEDMKATIAQMNDIFAAPGNKTSNHGIFSWENTFREAVMDMKFFVHNHKMELGAKEDFLRVSALLDEVYLHCMYDKSILSTIADDKIHIAVTAMMNQADIYGIKTLEAEYKALIAVLLSKKSGHINICFRHLSWAVGYYCEFFSSECFNNMLIAVLDTYSEYFSMEGNRQWDINGCEKEVAEQSLASIAQILRSRGYKHQFWSNYKKKFWL